MQPIMYPTVQQDNKNNEQRPKQSNKMKQGMKRRLRLLFVIFLCFAGWAAATIWERQATLDEKNVELQLIESKLEQAKQVNQEYEREITRLHDPEYIEQILRKDHLLTKEGETLFIKTK